MNKETAKELSVLRGTLDAWASALGKERRTLARVLKRNDAEVTAGSLYSAKQIFDGLLGSEHVQKVRNLELDAQKKEREEKAQMGELVKFEEVQKLLTEFVLEPITRTLNDWRATSKVKAELVDELMRIVRDGLPKPESNGS